MEMTRVLQVITLMVRPMKYIKPATSTMVPRTQKMMRAAPLNVPRKTRTVRNIAAEAEPMFWYNSLWMILSVTQLEYLTATGMAAGWSLLMTEMLDSSDPSRPRASCTDQYFYLFCSKS